MKVWKNIIILTKKWSPIFHTLHHIRKIFVSLQYGMTSIWMRQKYPCLIYEAWDQDMAK